MIKKEVLNRDFAKLSIILLSNYSQSNLINCLKSIEANGDLSEIEIIVAGVFSKAFVSELKSKDFKIKLLKFPDKTAIPVLAAAAIAESRGEIIAMIDSLCTVKGNWLASILKAHESALIVGGAVEVSSNLKYLDWAAYFCEYAQFALPLNSGPAQVLPGNNISFKRTLLATGREYVAPQFWKTYWCQKLRENGYQLTFDSSIVVYYEKKFELLTFLIRRFHHGRCFAGMRVVGERLAKRIFFFCGSFFLPLVFFCRTVTMVLSKKRFLGKLIFSLPFLTLAILFWSAGEAWGYLTTRGKSCDYICS